jgi:GNAT superfamily N-acetyltransferase
MYFKCIVETKEIIHRIPYNVIFLIYFKQKKPIAFSDYKLCRFPIQGYGFLRKEFTFVDKRYRNCGIAKTLMKYVAEKYSNYEIETIARNYLGNILENLGVITGNKKGSDTLIKVIKDKLISFLKK